VGGLEAVARGEHCQFYDGEERAGPSVGGQFGGGGVGGLFESCGGSLGGW
jgi:hypothetical protein